MVLLKRECYRLLYYFFLGYLVDFILKGRLEENVNSIYFGFWISRTCYGNVIKSGDIFLLLTLFEAFRYMGRIRKLYTIDS